MIYRWFAFFLAVVGILVWLVWIDRHKERWRYGVAPLTWLFNICAFYIFYFATKYCGTFAPLSINMWALIIQLHGLILTVGGGAILVWYARKGRRFDVQ